MLEFFCDEDNTPICGICISTIHQGHHISSMKDKIISDQNMVTLDKWNQYYIYKENHLKSSRDKIVKISESIENKENKLETETIEKLKNVNENLNLAKKEIEDIIQNSEKHQLNTIHNLESSIEVLEHNYEALLNEIEKELNSFGKEYINITFKSLLQKMIYSIVI